MATDILKQARGIYALLRQGQVWIDRQGVRHDITEMSARYKRNVVGYLERHARRLAQLYQFGQIQQIYGPVGREVLGVRNGEDVLGEVVYGGPSEGSIAADTLERELDDEQQRQLNDPIGWLRTTPLLGRLIDDIENGRGGTDGDDEHRRWVATRAGCGAFVAGGHDAYQSACEVCVEANSDAPDWTLS